MLSVTSLNIYITFISTFLNFNKTLVFFTHFAVLSTSGKLPSLLNTVFQVLLHDGSLLCPVYCCTYSVVNSLHHSWLYNKCLIKSN